MGKQGKRPRAEKRMQERALRAEVKAREAAVRQLPGGAPERPIEVDTPAVIEVQAQATRCHQCGGEPEILEHAAETVEGVRLRLVRSRCRRCHTPRELWFRLTAATLN